MVQNLTPAILNIHCNNIIMSGESLESPSVSTGLETPTFRDVPLSALSKGSRKKLSHLMNAKKILRSEDGYERDWRGLAFLAKQKNLCDDNIISGDDPMAKLIQLWCINNPNTATFAHLEKFLGVIDRWDVCDDLYEYLVDDSKLYQSKSQDVGIYSGPGGCTADIDEDFGHGSDPNILTTDDVLRVKKGLPLQRYDAFVLYADADLMYVTEMLTKLEDTEYNFKLCIKDRDLLAGVAFKHVALTKLIEERCKYLIVILTNAFLRSAENKFFVDFTQALQIEQKTRKIIPLLYESSIEIPRTLNIYTHLRYNASSMGFCDYWTKLANSIRNVNIGETLLRNPVVECEIHSTPLTSNRHLFPTSQAVENKQTPSTEIPSISINGNIVVPSECNQSLKMVDRPAARPLTMRRNRSNNGLTAPVPVLRNAHSTDHLHSSIEFNNAVSMSNISTSSESKKKKKWSKLLNKVFSRSNSKLQQQTT